MKMKIVLVLMVALISASTSFGQEIKTPRLSTAFGYDVQSIYMESLNSDYIVFMAGLSDDPIISDRITWGHAFGMNVSYHLSERYAVGVYAGYQRAGQHTERKVTEFNAYGSPIREDNTRFELRTEAFVAGLSGQYFLSDLWNWQEKQSALLRKGLWSVELNLGLGWSQVSTEYLDDDFASPLSSRFQSNVDFHSRMGLNYAYGLNNAVLGSIGLRAGFQFYRTAPVRDGLDREWITGKGNPINLDFSGFYLGLFLGVGR